MPENEKIRQQWCSKNMEDAVNSVLNGTYGYVKVPRIYEVSQTTLERRMTKARIYRDIISMLFGDAFLKAAKPDTAINGFP